MSLLGAYHQLTEKFIVSLNTITIPNIVSEALLKREWRGAMREEMSALEKNKT